MSRSMLLFSAITLTVFADLSCTNGLEAAEIDTIDIAPYVETETEGVTTEVTIYRDSMGIPHIYGEKSEDVMFGVGYALAEDRLFQFEMTRRAAAGELAEILGPDFVEFDKTARTVSYTEAQLQQMIDEMELEPRIHLRSMVDGINFYVEQMRNNPADKLPLEFASLNIEIRDYRPHDVLEAFSLPVRLFGASGGRELVNLAFLNDLKERYGNDLAEVIFNDVLVLNDPDAYSIDSPGTEVTIEPPKPINRAQLDNSTGHYRLAESLAARQKDYESTLSSLGLSKGASRSMVIGPDRSANGNVLMMQGTADGHEVHISGGGLEVAGLSFASIGLPVMGRTASFGWLITTAERDTVDIFSERLNPEDKYEYWFDGEWRSMEVREEIIQVAGDKPISISVATTIHGPVVAWELEVQRAYSKKWAVWMREGIGWSIYFEIARAKTLEDFEKITKKHIANGNYSYGDVNGHIESWHYNTLPLRADGIDPRLPTPGTGEFEWQGLQDYEDFPNIENPERQFNFIWNNKPTPNMTYGDSSRWGIHFRTYLPLSLLRSDDRITLEDMKRFNRTIAAGWGSTNLGLTSPQFFSEFWQEAIEQEGGARFEEAVRLMTEWNELYLDEDDDGFYDHPGLAIFRTWLPTALKLVFEDDLGNWWHKFDEDTYIKYGASLLIRVLEGEDAGLPNKFDFLNGRGRGEVVRDSLAETLQHLESEYGSDMPGNWKEPVMWRYMSDEALEADGDDALPTPNYIKSAAILGAAVDLGFVDKAVRHNGMPEWTTIIEFGESEPRLLSLIPSGGQSWFINTDGKANPHIYDQYQRHRDFDYKTIEMVKENVLKDVESTLVIKPVKRDAN